MDNPLVSVIVPIYNAEKYLADCIESILRQSYANIEILLVNDGSIDESGRICDKYAYDKRIIVFHQENLGVSAARNKALKNANGKWVVFVDADDTIDVNYIDSLVKSNISFSQNSLVVCGVVRMNRHTNKKDVIRFTNHCFHLENVEEYEYPYLDKVFLWGAVAGKLYSLDIIRRNNIYFNERLSQNEDHLFYFQYLTNIEEVITTDNIGYNYKYSDSDLSLSNKFHAYAERLKAYVLMKKAYSELIALYKDGNSHFQRTSSMICRIYIDVIQCCCINEKKAVCLDVIKKRDRKEIRNQYVPRSIWGHILKFILVFPLPDMCLYLLMTMVNTFHKYKR